MNNKTAKYSYQGMNQDVSKSKNTGFYFEGKNIRIISTNSQSTGSVTNEKGNELILEIPRPVVNKLNKTITYLNKTLNFSNIEITNEYTPNEIETIQSGVQKIIGHTFSRNDIILLTTDNNGFDCIWKVNDNTYDIELLYLRNLKFSENNPIQVLNNYENEIIDKIYWVDGISQMRFLNIYNNIENGDLENLIDLPSNSLLLTGTYNTSQPNIVGFSFGGTHTSGMIQYAYNLYKINGSSTKLSPTSELISLDKGIDRGGDAINEVVGKIPIVEINNIDNNYTNLKLYAIKYTSYNQIPSISLILDKMIIDNDTVTYYDDGSVIQSVSLEEFTFLGSDIVIPKHINTKDNIMFLANYEEKNFDINTALDNKSIDLRAYSFRPFTTSTLIYNSLTEVNGNVVSNENSLNVNSSTILTNNPKVDDKHSAINIDYDVYNRQYNSNILGGEGPFIKYKIVRNRVGVSGFTANQSKNTFLKDREIYRIGIQFYNEYGQQSLPKWIADFKTIVLGNESNLNGYYASVETTLKPLFYTWLNDNNNFLDKNGNFDNSLKPVGYKILRANRDLEDRTIICQGLINGMLSQVAGDTTSNSGTIGGIVPNDVKLRVERGVKIPSMMRRFDNFLSPMWRNSSYFRLDQFNSGHPEASVNDAQSREVHKSASSRGWTSGTYQFNNLMQMFSPEITFNFIQNFNESNLYVIGGIRNTDNQAIGELRNTETKIAATSIVIKNAISSYDKKAIVTKIGNDNLNEFGWFGPRDSDLMEFMQTYRDYTGEFYNAKNNFKYDIYGTPEIVETGQGRTVYNNDNDLIYYNSLEQLSTDTSAQDASGPDYGITSVNSWGAKNITFALGNNNVETINRLNLEKLHTLANIGRNDIGLISEFTIFENLVYLKNIYGGNSYESKKRTNYIEVGDYNKIDVNVYNCLNIGDTFVSNFQFTKLVKTETEVYSRESQQVTEIVNVRLETSIDLKNRNDLSISDWDNRFQPRYDEFQEYNKVYSQQPTLFLRRDLDYRFKSTKGFDTNVISTKVKVPGEIIDSWTDLQPNNVITLDGQYGPINTLHKFKNELYTLQDSATAFLSINPRVQVTGSDGLQVELGSGRVLQEYKYISTESGTLNKWSVVTTPSGFYYYDALNKSFNAFKGGLQGISSLKGLHTHFNNNTSLNELRIDNPLIKKGIASNYDYINSDLFMTFHQEEKPSFTLSFNEKADSFVSFYDYIPSMYLSKGDNFITINPTNTSIYKQYSGDYNKFYEQYYPSYVTLLINPESDLDTVFDNIMYKSEIYLNDIDQPEKTLTNVRLFHEYQDSGIVPLILSRNGNLRRKFRNWNAILPRNQNTRERIRNPWVFLQLQLDNESNYKMILHDIIVQYSV